MQVRSQGALQFLPGLGGRKEAMMEILLPAGTEAQGQAPSGFKGTDPADLDSLVTGQKEPRISR